MYIQRFSSILLLLLTTLPTSLTAPPINGVSAGPLAAHVDVECYERTHGPRCITPFPSNCRTLANNIRNLPDAGTTMIFDGRLQDPTQPHIPVPFRGEFGTCGVLIDRMTEICFTVGPGQERAEYSVAAATYDQDAVPSGTGKFRGVMFGPDLPGSANVTDDGDGSACGEIVESVASRNGSTNGLVNGGSGTAEQQRVDVT